MLEVPRGHQGVLVGSSCPLPNNAPMMWQVLPLGCTHKWKSQESWQGVWWMMEEEAWRIGG